MHLTPHEQEKLLIYVAADIAEKRWPKDPERFHHSERVQLNYPEAIALISRYIMEGARRGSRCWTWPRMRPGCSSQRS